MSRDLFNLEAVIESASKKFIEGEETVQETAILSESVMFAIEESVVAGSEHILFESVAYETSIAVLEAKSEKDDEDKEDDEDEEEKDKKDDDDKEDDEDKDDDKKDDDESCVDESLLKTILESSEGNTAAGTADAEKKGSFKDKLKDRGAKVIKVLGESWNKLVAMFTNIINNIKATALEKLGSYEKFANERANEIIAGAKSPKAKDLTLNNAFTYGNIGKVNVKTGEKFLLEVSTYVRSKGASLLGFDAIKGNIGDKEKALISMSLDEISKAAVSASMKKDYGMETTDVRAGVTQFARGKKLSNLAEIGGQDLIYGLKGTKPLMDTVKVADKSIKDASAKANASAKALSKTEGLDKETLDYIAKVDALYRVAYSFELNQQLGLLDAIRSRGLSFYQMAKAAVKLSGAKVQEEKPAETKESPTNESTLVGEFMDMLG